MPVLLKVDAKTSGQTIFYCKIAAPGPEEGCSQNPGPHCAFRLGDPQVTMRGVLCISNWPYDGVLVINEARANFISGAEVYAGVLSIFFEKSETRVT